MNKFTARIQMLSENNFNMLSLYVVVVVDIVVAVQQR